MVMMEIDNDVEMSFSQDPEMDYTSPITSEMLERWRSYVATYPLPPHLTPVGGSPLSEISDEALLTCPPSLIGHVQRTASQGGLQIVSPRQTPFSSLLNRRVNEKRIIGEHEVGSIADPRAEWPTIDDANFDTLLPDQPLAPMTDSVVMRAKTKTKSLTKGMEELADPVLACLVKGRAVIDILRRNDVAGDADQMTSLLANAWGIEESDINDLDSYSLGVEGDLQRHAMKVDEVYPTLYAPIHIRSVISMGVSDMDKGVLMPGMAMDWRRMRVFCEAIFYLACSIERLPIKYMKYNEIPGQKSNSRANMMVFIPGAATAWCAAPETFALCPVATKLVRRRPDIPLDVRDALQNYVRRVRPVSALLAGGARPGTWLTNAGAVTHVLNETLSGSFTNVTRKMATGPYRGKMAASAVRNAIYSIVETAPLHVRTRIARYLTLAAAECKEHLGLDMVPDTVVRELGSRFAELGGFLREKLASEAERRGETLTSWWEDLIAQVPSEYSKVKESTSGWCMAAIWLAFREPTDRWRKLKYAMQFRALAAAAVDSVGDVPLPAEKGSPDRLLVATRTAVLNISASFSGFYMGVADVGMAVAKAAEDMGRSRTAMILREGAYMWVLRSRSLRAINVSLIAKEEKLKSKNHFRVVAEPVDLALKPAPYRPFQAWKKHVLESKDIPISTKKMIREADSKTDNRLEAEDNPGEGQELKRKSSVFVRMLNPVLVCKKTTVTRYLHEPATMGVELEQGWMELLEDVKKVVMRLKDEVAENRAEKRKQEVIQVSTNLAKELMESDAKQRKIEEDEPASTYWDMVAMATDIMRDGWEAAIDEMPLEMAETIYEGVYTSVEDVCEQIAMHSETLVLKRTATKETVR